MNPDSKNVMNLLFTFHRRLFLPSVRMLQTMLNPWNLSPAEAIDLQSKLAAAVVRHNRFGPVNTVAGVDVVITEELTWGAAGDIGCRSQSGGPGR